MSLLSARGVLIQKLLMQSGQLFSPVHEIDNIESHFFCEMTKMFWMAADSCWNNEHSFSGFTDSIVLLAFADLSDFLTEDQEERPC